MLKYPALDHTCGIHILEYTLQYEEWTGHILRKVRGNVRGAGRFICLADLIDTRVFSKNKDIEIIPVTDKDVFFFDVTFLNDGKGMLNIQLEYEELNQLITKIEIVDFVEEEMG